MIKQHPKFVHPTHCFCQIAEKGLRSWAIRRYAEGRSTIELLDSTDDPHEREVISIVATLDLDEETMLELMGEVDKPVHHIVHCRENIRRMLGLSGDK